MRSSWLLLSLSLSLLMSQSVLSDNGRQCKCAGEDPPKPVCGVDDVTYVSQCQASCKEVAVSCAGECPCPKEEEPATEPARDHCVCCWSKPQPDFCATVRVDCSKC